MSGSSGALGGFGLRPPLPQSRAAWLGAAGALALAALLGAALWRWAGRRAGSARLQRVGTVSGLFLYPVKSCGGVALQRAEVTALGLRSGAMRDRFWLLITEDGHMVTARQEPQLVLISVNCENGYLTLNAPEMKELRVPIKLSRKNAVHNCRLFGLDIQGRDCGDEAAQWFATFLNTQSYRLVHFESQMAPRKSRDIFTTFRSKDEIAYPDCSPAMILSEASLEDLNTRLEKKVKIQNFRPNIVVSGCNAYEEDSWNKIKIGNVEMKGTMACPRCILTTIDMETGIIDRKEPLETLKSYRLCDPSERQLYKSHPLFGWYYGIDKTGTLQVGDPVYKIVN